MPFVQRKLDRIFNQTRGIFDKFAYQPENGDTIDDILADGYFEQSRFAGDPDWPGSIIEIVAKGGSRVFEITPDGRSAQAIGADETGFADDVAMYWRGQWQDGNYAPGDTVVDGNWTMVCVRKTTDRAAPQPTGDKEPLLPSSLPWDTNNATDFISSGHTYEFSEGGWLTEVQAWLPEVGPDVTYTVIVITTGIDGDVSEFETNAFVGPAGQWVSTPVPQTVVAPGTVIRILLRTYKSNATNNWGAFQWIYRGASETAPTNTLWNNNDSQTVVRISNFDRLNTDRSGQLSLSGPGSTLRMENSADSSQFIEYFVTNTVSQGTYFEYDVNVTDAGNALGFNAITDITSVYLVYTPAQYVQEEDYWLTNQPDYATVSGFLLIGEVGTLPPVADDAFGINIVFQPGAVSPDWDFMAYTTGIES